ncbi:hypothetical protein EDD16DRAFT_1707739 [Pisolithus croceorrhizus]|nr:hypothetical protein EDD16DRAFT_1707739 [Pisolithus croceorrhizus]
MPRTIDRVTVVPPSDSADSQFVLVMVLLSPLPSRPLIPTPQVLAHSSDLAGRLGRERSARVALSPGYVAGQNRASSIGSSLVDRTRHCRVTQDHTSDYITNHDTTLPPSYTNPLPPYAVGQSSGYPQHGRDVSAFGDLGNSFAGPTIGLSPAPLHNYTSGQVIDSDVPWSQLSNPLFPSLQQPHPSDDFAIGNIPLPPEQTRTEIELIRPWTLSPYTQPNLSRSNSTSYSTSGGYILSHPYFPTPNQNSSSWSSQEHLGHPYTRPVDRPGFHRFDTGSKIELHTSGVLDDHTAQVLGDHPLHTLSDYKTHPFCNSATNTPDDHTTGGGADDYRKFNASKFNPEQVVGLPPQLPLPPNQLPLSSRKLHSHDRGSRVKGKSLSKTTRHTRRSAASRSQHPARLSKACLAHCCNVSISCGWRDDGDRECGMPVNCSDCADHFATVHGIKNKAWDVKITCRWCPSEPETAVIRKNFSRHMKEVHLGCPRSKSGI